MSCCAALYHVLLCHAMLCHVVIYFVASPGGPVSVHVDVQRNERAGRGRAVEYQTANLLREKFLWKAIEKQ